MSKYIVTNKDGQAAHNEITGRLLTWDTREGAQRFVDLNGGFVTEFAVIDATVSTMQTHGPLQHSPDEAQPVEG
jgi:hypothetical protein